MIEIWKLHSGFQEFLGREEMVGVRRFVENYRLGDVFDGTFDPHDPIDRIEERVGDSPPLVEIVFNVRLRDGTRQHPRCVISRRGLFPTVGVVMLSRDGRLALMHEFRVQSGCTYVSVPSGCVEKGESMVAAALREGRREAHCQPTSTSRIYELRPHAYHGAIIAMFEMVFVVTDVESVLSDSDSFTDSDEWITDRRFVTPTEFTELVRNPPDGVHLHAPTLACVATAQAHGFFLPSVGDLAALSGVRENLRPLASE